MCLVQINFVVIRLKKKCLGCIKCLWMMWLRIILSFMMVEGLRWEVYEAECLHTIHARALCWWTIEIMPSSSISFTTINLSISRPTSYGYAKWNIAYLVQWLKSNPLVDFSFQGFKYETLLCLEERRAGTLKWILWWKVNMTSIYKGQGLRFMS